MPAGPRLVARVVRDDPQVCRVDMTLRSSLLRPPVHRHPGREERIDVREGTLTVRLGATSRRLGPGQGVVVRPGAWHTSYNRSHRPARFVIEVRPGAGLAAFFEGLAVLVSGPPRPVALISLFARHAAAVELRAPAAAAVRLLARLDRSRSAPPSRDVRP